MAATYIHTCYRILDPARSEDFYVNKLGMKMLGEGPSPTTRATATPPDGFKVELVQRGTMKVGAVIQ